MMDITSRKLPLAIIGVLLAVLVIQYVVDAPDSNMLIDPATCEIYTQDSYGSAKQYTGEFDQKCMDLLRPSP